MGDLPRKHESTKPKPIWFSCFPVFVASSVSSYGLPGSPFSWQRAAPFLDVRFVLVPEVLQRGQHRRDRRVAERAKRFPGDVAGDAAQQIQIAHLPFAALDALQNLVQPIGSLAARRAFAAGLVTVKVEEVLREPDHAGG